MHTLRAEYQHRANGCLWCFQSCGITSVEKGSNWHSLFEAMAVLRSFLVRYCRDRLVRSNLHSCIMYIYGVRSSPYWRIPYTPRMGVRAKPDLGGSHHLDRLSSKPDFSRQFLTSHRRELQLVKQKALLLLLKSGHTC